MKEINKFEPYMSVDIETSGLPDEDAAILQLAAVFEDFTSDRNSLLTFNCIIDPGPLLTGNIYALSLNKWILDEILKHRKGKFTNIPVLTLEEAINDFNWFVDRCKRRAGIHKDKRISMGGKNVEGFDKVILKQNGFELKDFKHRCVDPGSMYYSEFGFVPSLDQISDLLSLGKVTHDALDDAFRVVDVIRTKLQHDRIRDDIINRKEGEVDEGVKLAEALSDY